MLHTRTTADKEKGREAYLHADALRDDPTEAANDEILAVTLTNTE
jgi:hypothetical protein